MLQEFNVPNVEQLEPTQQETMRIRDSNHDDTLLLLSDTEPENIGIPLSKSVCPQIIEDINSIELFIDFTFENIEMQDSLKNFLQQWASKAHIKYSALNYLLVISYFYY
uniref:Uncharacterized protein n=1 Tax=Lepeophtheirus salmonis TaxID=72036 RepID=A0A0K2VGE0_LEPSM